MGGGKDRETADWQMSGRPVTEAVDCTLAQGDTHGHVPGGEGPAPTCGLRFAGGRAAPGWNLASGKDMSPGAPHQAPLRYPGRHD